MKKIAENVNNAFRRLRRIDYHNQCRLYNTEATIISSNCTGGFLMHWLGMRFNTPFINLALNDKDFILMLEHWDEFLEYPLIEVKDHEKIYPV